jgi:diaminohydroxyphosphoribosylaminopyrimidine deaminase/5-amino-6-(5-phosphoribosylamino)uracil reductase
MAGIGTVLADDPMLNCRLLQSEASANSSHLQLTEGISASFTVGQSEHASLPPHQPLRVIVDSQLRIPLDSQICRSARDYPTIVACAQREEEKAAALEALGIRVLCFPPTSEVPCSDSGSASVSETVSSDFGTASVNETAAAQTEHTDLRALVTWLGQNKYDSILIEGGGTLHEAALRAGIVNHVCAYIAPKLLGGREAKTPVEGIGADCPELGAQLTNLQITPLGDDLLLSYDIAGGMNHVYWNC